MSTNETKVLSASRSVKYIVVHHSATPRGISVESIKEWHLSKGWLDIGYHYIIDQDGALHVGRDFFMPAAANMPVNDECVAICIVGNNCEEEDKWTFDQKISLEVLIDSIIELFPEAKVVGHRDIGSTATECPGLDLDKIWDGENGANNGRGTE